MESQGVKKATFGGPIRSENLRPESAFQAYRTQSSAVYCICDFNREQQQVLYKVEVQAPFAGGPVLFDVLNQGGEEGVSVRGAKHKKDRRSRGREPEDS